MPPPFKALSEEERGVSRDSFPFVRGSIVFADHLHLPSHRYLLPFCSAPPILIFPASHRPPPFPPCSTRRGCVPPSAQTHERWPLSYAFISLFHPFLSLSLLHAMNSLSSPSPTLATRLRPTSAILICTVYSQAQGRGSVHLHLVFRRLCFYLQPSPPVHRSRFPPRPFRLYLPPLPFPYHPRGPRYLVVYGRIQHGRFEMSGSTLLSHHVSVSLSPAGSLTVSSTVSPIFNTSTSFWFSSGLRPHPFYHRPRLMSGYRSRASARHMQRVPFFTPSLVLPFSVSSSRSVLPVIVRVTCPFRDYWERTVADREEANRGKGSHTFDGSFGGGRPC
jgi:hypothetical protein